MEGADPTLPGFKRQWSPQAREWLPGKRTSGGPCAGDGVWSGAALPAVQGQAPNCMFVACALLCLMHFSKKKKKAQTWSSCCGSAETNPTRNRDVAGSIPGLTQWVKHPEWLWLWCRPVAAAPVRPLAWEPPCAAGAALKRRKKKKKKRRQQKGELWMERVHQDQG